MVANYPKYPIILLAEPRINVYDLYSRLEWGKRSNESGKNRPTVVFIMPSTITWA